MATSKKAQRLLRVFLAMDAHPVIGISNKELSDGLGLTPSQVSRDIDDLVASGLVIKLENGNYAYGIKTLQIAERFRKQQERLNARLQELENRIYQMRRRRRI
ncbi:TPA: winged helix-turn-helix transcriptional regulator [Neisseria gonorrhoeae]